MSNARLVHREETPAGGLEVWDDDRRRSLWFDAVILQSEIDRDDPAVLPNPVNQAMLAHLMYVPAPRRVLLAGCGGGAIARWFHARSPATAGDAVERSPDVARVARDWFDFPGAASNWSLTVADVRDRLADHPPAYDFILVDIEERHWTPDWVGSAAFLAQCRAALAPAGVLTVNTISRNAADFSALLRNIRQALGPHTACLQVPRFDNVLVMAFTDPPATTAPDVAAAARTWGLPFGRYATALRRLNPPGSGLF